MDFSFYANSHTFGIESLFSSSVLKQTSLTQLLLELTFFGSVLLSILTCKRFRSRSSSPQHRLPRPPVVEGSLPLLGHWWQMSKDPVAFLRAAYERHGPIFQVNIFLKKVVYVCDREMQEEFYNAPNNQLSLPGVLDDMKLPLIFIDRLAEYWPTLNRLVRRSMAVSYPKYTPIIKAGAEEAVRLLHKSRDLEAELTRYIVTTPPRCLFNISSTESLFNDFVRFKSFFKAILMSSYVLPRWTVNRWVRSLARKFIAVGGMGAQFLPEISKYFDDPAYDTSALTRMIVDQEFDAGTKLTPEDIKNLALLLVHKTSENTINFLRSVVLDLAENPEWLERVREECAEYVDGLEITDVKALLQSKLLHACCMESGRLNANIVVSRRSLLPHSTLGGHFIGHCQEVVACATFFMVESTYHKNSLQYNPDRFLTDREMFTPKYITTWGSGVHQCPGKVFVLNVAKMFVALVAANYNIELQTSGRQTDKSYFTLSPLIVRSLNARLTEVNNN